MREYYPLTAAQRMHHSWIQDYKTQQVSGVSVVASLRAALDFGLLKKCIQLEFERYGCMRVRFTKPDKKGEVKQYVVKKDTRDIPLKDLSGQEDISIQNFISRRSTHDEWTSGGSRTIMFPCRTVIPADTEFMAAAYEIQNVQNRIYMHSNYDPALIQEEIRKRYHTPEHTTYESCYLTYQPMPVKVDNPHLANVPQHSKWFANGAATKKVYLTVSHTDNGGMNFSFHYQTAHLDPFYIEQFEE